MAAPMMAVPDCKVRQKQQVLSGVSDILAEVLEENRLIVGKIVRNLSSIAWSIHGVVLWLLTLVLELPGLLQTFHQDRHWGGW